MAFPAAFLLVALATAPCGQATTTTTAEGSAVVGTTTTHDGGASEDMSTVTGIITITGLNFAGLSADTTLMAAVETQCKLALASAAGVATTAVGVTLSSGSVVVDYTIAVASSAASSCTTGLTTAINDNSLTGDLITALQDIPNINNAVDATLSATASTPTIVDTPEHTSAARTTSVVAVSGVMAFAAFTAAFLN